MTGDSGSACGGFGLLNARLQEAVQALIDAGHDPGDAAAGLYISDDRALQYARVADAASLDDRLAEAAVRLGLGVLETEVLGLVAGPELDPRYGKVFSFLHDDVTRKLPSLRLIAETLEGADVDRSDVIGCFSVSAPLRRLGCVELLDGDGERPFLDRAVKLAEPLTAFLLGTPLVESPLASLRPIDTPGPGLGRPETVARLRSLLSEPSSLPIIVVGADAPGVLARAAGAPLLLADFSLLSDRKRATLICALEGRQLAFDGVDELDPAARARCAATIEASRDRVLLCARTAEAAVALGSSGALVVSVPAPTLSERRRAWREFSPGADSEEVAQKFRLSIAQIATAGALARVQAAAQLRELPSAADLASGARQASMTQLGELASRLTASYTWSDLVLPERALERIQSVSAYLRHRDQVLSDWGYERTAHSQGLKVLFAGESGTGKTMAAQVLANELGLELFHVDLATIVSKYIGETEKNLDRIFTAAEGSNAILFFDEADALFGKRSDVSDAHDRYANIEVAYLLQKMDSYAGAIILATNFKQNIDSAFQRRLDFSIDFPFPEYLDRRRIWQLVLPEQAPLGADIDLDFLSTRFKLSGGSIRNCSLAAAFEAAAANEPIGMPQLVRAVAREYEKQGRLTLEVDFERFFPLVKGGGEDGVGPAIPPPDEPEPIATAAPRDRIVIRSRIEEIGG